MKNICQRANELYWTTLWNYITEFQQLILRTSNSHSQMALPRKKPLEFREKSKGLYNSGCGADVSKVFQRKWPCYLYDVAKS